MKRKQWESNGNKSNQKAASPCGLDALTRPAALGVMFKKEIRLPQENSSSPIQLIFEEETTPERIAEFIDILSDK
jgi:hypothetical protein